MLYVLHSFFSHCVVIHVGVVFYVCCCWMWKDTNKQTNKFPKIYTKHVYYLKKTYNFYVYSDT